MRSRLQKPLDAKQVVWLFDDGDQERIKRLQAAGWWIVDKSTLGSFERIELSNEPLLPTEPIEQPLKLGKWK